MWGAGCRPLRSCGHDQVVRRSSRDAGASVRVRTLRAGRRQGQFAAACPVWGRPVDAIRQEPKDPHRGSCDFRLHRPGRFLEGAAVDTAAMRGKCAMAGARHLGCVWCAERVDPSFESSQVSFSCYTLGYTVRSMRKTMMSVGLGVAVLFALGVGVSNASAAPATALHVPSTSCPGVTVNAPATAGAPLSAADAGESTESPLLAKANAAHTHWVTGSSPKLWCSAVSFGVMG
jgi:hypothetical protein